MRIRPPAARWSLRWWSNEEVGIVFYSKFNIFEGHSHGSQVGHFGSSCIGISGESQQDCARTSNAYGNSDASIRISTCWAASTAMIFASNGRALSNQEIIIQRDFQAQPQTQTCTTASPNTITQLLNDNGLDAAGRGFKSSVVAGYDIYSGRTNIDNNIIVNELSNNRPLLYCNRHHAMVIVAMEYFDTPMGPNPQSVWVMDPFPTSPPFHPLSPQEMMPAHMGGDYCYSAAVVIT